jgi:hypothetical protein
MASVDSMDALAAGMRVIGVATTLEAEALRRDVPLQAVIRDYTEVKVGDFIKSL